MRGYRIRKKLKKVILIFQTFLPIIKYYAGLLLAADWQAGIATAMAGSRKHNRAAGHKRTLLVKAGQSDLSCDYSITHTGDLTWEIIPQAFFQSMASDVIHRLPSCNKTGKSLSSIKNKFHNELNKTLYKIFRQ